MTALDMSLPHPESEGIYLWDFSFLQKWVLFWLEREIVPQKDREHWHQHKNFCPYVTTELCEVQ